MHLQAFLICKQQWPWYIDDALLSGVKFAWRVLFKLQTLDPTKRKQYQLDMSTARRRLKSPQSLSGTSAHPTMMTLVNIMVMNGWLTSFSFHVNRPSHSWDRAISDFDLEISTPGSRSWVWSKDKVIQSAQYHINSLPFHFTSIRPTIPEKFDVETSKVKVMSEVKSQGHILYPVFNRCTSFSFHINRTNHSWDMARLMFDLEITHPNFFNENLPK